jgi:hypothetical protein
VQTADGGASFGAFARVRREFDPGLWDISVSTDRSWLAPDRTRRQESRASVMLESGHGFRYRRLGGRSLAVADRSVEERLI